MESSELSRLHRAETLAVVYLVAPLFVFFAFFIRLEIAIPACAFIAYLVYELVRNTSWRASSGPRWEPFYFLLVAAMWVWLSGGLEPVHQNNDWYKHYAILNFLTEHSWPAVDQFQQLPNSALRYYIGWYLIPSLVLKLTELNFQLIAVSAWSILGIFLFFNLLPDLVGRRWALIAAPIVFVVFGGADLLGMYLTQSRPVAPYHFEWWVGWVQFSSNTTALFWVPQHAIPAWLGVAFLMRLREHDTLLPYCALVASAILLWSPFSAIGLAPFLLALIVQHGPRKLILNWRPLGSVLLLAIPVGLYLIAGSGGIPHGYIGTVPCLNVPGVWAGCFEWSSYLLFLLIEIGLPVAILFLRRDNERGFLAAAAIFLCLLPLYRLGAVNDFTMRASLPSLAVLAILSAKLLANGPKLYSIAILSVLLAGFPNAAGEILRGFLPRESISPDSTFRTPALSKDIDVLYPQYFAPMPLWVLRQQQH